MSAASITGRGAGNDVRAIGLILPIALLLALGMSYAFYLFPPNGVIVLAGTLGLAGTVALALLRYELAVALGFLLMGVVRSEPAPPDAIFAVVIAIAVVTGRFSLQRVPLVVFSLLGTFVVLNFLSAVEAVSTGAAGRFMLITLYLAVFGVWLTSFVDSVDRARLIVRPYIGGAVFWALLTSLALYLPVPGREHLVDYDGTRGYGLFEDPNVYGPFLIPAALIVAEEMLTPRLLRSKSSAKLVMFCILATGVILSYSRAGSISLIVAMVVLLATLTMRRGGGRRAVALLAVMVVGGGAVGGVLAISGSVGFLQQRSSLQTYDTDRFGAQEQGIRLAEQQPFGIGPGQFDVLVEISTHSTYIRVLAEQGILGFVVILGLLLTTLILAGRNAVLGRDTYGIGSAALLAAWVALLINSSVVDTLHWRHLFFVAALIWAGSRRPTEELDQVGAPGSPLTSAGRLAR
ncbi:MAG: O-antigen ligase family protein [Solirubrobacteraceae bacterium]